MELCVHAHLDYELAGPTDLLSQIEAADTPEQAIEWRDPILLRAEHVACLPAQDRNERRIWLRTPGKMVNDYRTMITRRSFRFNRRTN